MKNFFDAVLTAGFVAVDFFFFHDFFKSGDAITIPQYLTGALSLIVITESLWSLLKSNRSLSA